MTTASRKKKSHPARLNATRPHPTVGALHEAPAFPLGGKVSAKLTDEGATPAPPGCMANGNTPP
jgi:hypothetical protein